MPIKKMWGIPSRGREELEREDSRGNTVLKKLPRWRERDEGKERVETKTFIHKCELSSINGGRLRNERERLRKVFG
jgi:hypothetical protein